VQPTHTWCESSASAPWAAFDICFEKPVDAVPSSRGATTSPPPRSPNAAAVLAAAQVTSGKSRPTADASERFAQPEVDRYGRAEDLLRIAFVRWQSRRAQVLRVRDAHADVQTHGADRSS